jgi:DeoR/GlpR family transcriptional regulator of sugar metabolism
MPSNGLLNEERRREILAALHRDGRVLVKDLARHFRISQITIRKDLEFLDGQGVIQRTHGGALPVQAGALLDPTLREKERLHRRQKMQIARAAVCLMEEGQSVLLDSGTTTTAIARALKDMSRLTVITNAINIAAELAGTHIEVILTGGTLAQKLVFPGRSPGRANSASTQRRHFVSRRRWLRHQGRAFHPEFVGVGSESGYGPNCPPDDSGLRFE